MGRLFQRRRNGGVNIVAFRQREVKGTGHRIPLVDEKKNLQAQRILDAREEQGEGKGGQKTSNWGYA